jgi:hypothetical protein
MSIHTIIVLLVLYCAVRALLRKKPRDPMAGRLIPRSRELHATICARAKLEHDTFAARHTVDFNPPPSRSDLFRAASYKYDCINRRWHAGYATYEEKLAAYAALREVQGDLLAGYRSVA